MGYEFVTIYNHSNTVHCTPLLISNGVIRKHTFISQFQAQGNRREVVRTPELSQQLGEGFLRDWSFSCAGGCHAAGVRLMVGYPAPVLQLPRESSSAAEGTTDSGESRKNPFFPPPPFQSPTLAPHQPKLQGRPQARDPGKCGLLVPSSRLIERMRDSLRDEKQQVPN